jgi:hypothetical protein
VGGPVESSDGSDGRMAPTAKGRAMEVKGLRRVKYLGGIEGGFEVGCQAPSGHLGVKGFVIGGGGTAARRIDVRSTSPTTARGRPSPSSPL